MSLEFWDGKRAGLRLKGAQSSHTHKHAHTSLQSSELQLPRALKSRCPSVIEGPAGSPALLISFFFYEKDKQRLVATNTAVIDAHTCAHCDQACVDTHTFS